MLCAGVGPNVLAAQYYGMPGATAQSWGMYPAQNSVMSGQQTPGTPGTPQPGSTGLMRSQGPGSRTLPPQHQQTEHDALTAATLHPANGT